MSWFDTSGLAELAKNALKEAQKTIDKALDIQDEEMLISSVTSPSTVTSQQQQQQQLQEKCKTEPATPIQPLWQGPMNPTLWGSFTGSFFDNPKNVEMVTTPPKCGLSSQSPSPASAVLKVENQVLGVGDSNISISGDKRQSVHSNSDSIEILSSPATPCSGVTSPSSATVYNSESVEVITPTSSEICSPDSIISPDSVEIITSDEILEDDDDSMSYNTVMDDSSTTMQTIAVAGAVTTTTSSPSSLKQTSVSNTEPTTSSSCVTDSCESVKTLTDSNHSTKTKTNIKSFTEDSLIDSQTLLSDSTQSFEDIQIPDNTSIEEKDMVKVNSDATSGHTSADEVETTTSSDIEIISNPNGDSSSTNSVCRASPLKSNVSSSTRCKVNTHNDFKIPTKKGHCREPSEVSTQSDDSQLSNSSETDKLLRRISELSEILESREIRLIEMGKHNAELQEKNAEFQALLDARQKKKDHLETEEYTQRLSALEKKFQMSIRERDALREQLKLAHAELTTKIPKDDLDKTVAEKDFMIGELRTEGEKLSKQILQHSNIIKKLRAKERETDAILKRNKDQITEMTDEVERLKKSLMAKEEVERSQIEAVHKLSSEKRKLERENQTMKGQLEDLNSKLETLQKSLEAAKKELYDKQNAHQELSKKAHALSALETEKHQTEIQNAEILSQMEDLRRKLQIAETGNSLREQKLRQDNADLLRRLEAAEIRSEELTQEISAATIPLVRQLEALQSTLTSRTNNWEKQEKELVSKLEEAQRKLKELENVEKTSRDQQQILNHRIKSLEERLSSALLKSEQATSALQQAELDFSLKETDYRREITDLKNKLNELNKKHEEVQKKYQLLEKNVEIERSLIRKNELTEDRPSQDDSSPRCNTTNAGDAIANDECGGGGDGSGSGQQFTSVRNASPTASLGRNSVADSLGSSAWQMDDLDCVSNSDRPNFSNNCTSSIYGLNTSFNQYGGGHSATIFENLQSSLKQRDGEVSQLQWELSRLQIERNVLNDEISNLTIEIENLKDKLQVHETLEKEFAELQRKYDALLQMYGEKVEEAQELELDLQDVKEMYKAQINELLKQKNSNST